MKISKKDLLQHFAAKASIHKVEKERHLSKIDQKMGHANLHKGEAERFAVSDPALAEFHRGKSAIYKAEAAGHRDTATKHSAVQQHYENLREHLTASPDEHVDVDADVINEHSDSSRSLQSVAAGDAGLLKRCGILQD